MSTYTTDPNGLIWLNGGAETDDHLAFGGHETYLIDIARSLLPAGGFFVDVGAHVGLYTLNLANKAGFVAAIEANPNTFDVLLANIALNRDRFPDCGFSKMNMAAWDKREPLSMVDENGKQTGGSTRCVESADPTTYGIPLDEVLPDRKIDLVKIDVEGAEARVLKGMSKRLVSDRPTLLIEMHDMYFGEQIRIDTLAILQALGYRWNDDLIFGGSYYLVAQPVGAVDDFVIETVKAGM